MKNLGTINLNALESKALELRALKLRTKRLILRPFREDDVSQLYYTYCYKNLFKTVESIDNLAMLEIKNIISNRIASDSIDNSFCSWAIILQGKNIIIGSIIVKNVKYSIESCTLNCYINPLFRNNNFATEALDKVIHYLSTIVGVKRIDILCSYNNLAFQSLCKKCGMVREAVLRNCDSISGKISSLSVYAKFNNSKDCKDFYEDKNLKDFIPENNEVTNSRLTKPKIIPDTVIKTDRLLLRSITIADADDLFRHLFSKESSLKFLNTYVHKKVKDTIAFIKCTIDDYERNPYEKLWVIELKGLGCIGFIGVKLENKCVNYYSVYYGIGEEFRNRGIATEALKILINFLKTEIKARRVEVMCACANISSEKVIRKAGLIYEGTLHKFYKCKGEIQDVKVYSLINS